MALRTSKITSEVLHTCNKYFSTKPDVVVKASTRATERANTESPKTAQSYRYTIKNTEKPRSLPQIRFGDDKEFTNFSDLQPSAEPVFNFEYRQSKWSEDVKDSSPFPRSIKPNSSVNIVYSDLQKAEDKLLKSKIDGTIPQYRNFSTMVVRHYGRAPADNNSAANCAKKLNKCVHVTKPGRQCKMNKNCPRFKIADCKQSKGSDCKLNYLDPNCSKKYAPYPSYSESCAENLPDDPSECQQCPWRTCDSADRIEPGKPVRGRRHYSTSSALQRNLVNGVVTRLPQPPPESILPQDIMCSRKCGVTKKPCKEPPGPCEVRRKNEEQARHEKDKEGPSKKKKALDFENGMVLGGVSSNLVPIINPYTLETVRLDIEGTNPFHGGSWIDIDCNDVQTGLWATEKKDKHPYCNRKRKPKRPKANAVDLTTDIEYGNVDWWSGRGKKTVITEPMDNDCGRCQQPKQTIKSKQKIHLAPTIMADKKKRFDEGHPPPCETGNGSSKNCPKEKLKKPKFKKRPLAEGFYKRPEDPYNKED